MLSGPAKHLASLPMILTFVEAKVDNFSEEMVSAMTIIAFIITLGEIM